MIFSIPQALEILERTPAVLHSLLNNLSAEWTTNNEGPDTWSAYDIVGHLVHGEETDWIPRMEIILSNAPERKFTPFDRFAQFKESKEKTLLNLLDEFNVLRKRNLSKLKSHALLEDSLQKTGMHPAFGEVTLSQLLSTWVVHDLNHIAQITRVMAKQYKSEVGPWYEYLGILKRS